MTTPRGAGFPAGREPGRRLAFPVVACGVFLTTMDSSMVNLALPAIMDHFREPLRATEWVVLAYLLTITATLLVWGRLGDRWGRRRLYVCGLVAFGCGALACSRAPTFAALVAARVVQALGGAMMMACGPALLRDNVPSHHLGKTFGLVGVAVSLGLMSGPSVGGVVLHLASWRTLFLLPVPLAVGTALLARWRLPPSPRQPGNGFDIAGVLLWGAGLGSLVAGLSLASGPAVPVGPVLTTLAGGGVLLWLFGRRQLVAAAPLFPVTLGRQRFFVVAVSCAAVSFLVLFTVTVLTPFYLVRVLGVEPYLLGLTMMAVPLAAMVVAPVAGGLSDRIGARLLTTAGLALAAGGLVLFALLASEETSLVTVAAVLFLVGAGQAMFLSPNSSSVLRRVGEGEAAAAAAVLATARNLGMLAGIALSGLAFAWIYAHISGGFDVRDYQPQHVTAFLAALRTTLLLAAATGTAGAFLSWQRDR